MDQCRHSCNFWVGDKMEKICCNCKNATQVNTFYQGIDGEMYPHNAYLAHCPIMDSYVESHDCCDDFESCIKTVKVPYKNNKEMV